LTVFRSARAGGQGGEVLIDRIHETRMAPEMIGVVRDNGLDELCDATASEELLQMIGWGGL
jgi:hypothetical protein